MVKNDYLVRATKFMNDFSPYLKERKDINAVKEAVARFNMDKKRKVIFHHGACRFALITSDYVIKWDYNPRYVKDFGGCKGELKTYNKIKKAGYDYLFAPITPIKVGRRLFYVMPRVINVKGKFHHNQGLWKYLTKDEENYVYRGIAIGDLHDANWGLSNGKPIIIDYACS